MDKKRLLQPEIQSFMKAHEGDDLVHLMLQKDKYAELPLREIIEQLKSRKKAEKKLPTWYKTEGLLYPPTVSVEQASSEITARYKANLFSGNLALDLTGGFGVDSFYMAQKFDGLTYVEKNTALAQIAEHNFNRLQQVNIRTVSATAEIFLKDNNQRYDLIYIDPDRRPKQKRVTGFEESTPDLPKLLPKLLSLSKYVLVKASPMMDIALGVKQLGNVKMVIIIAVENEVKELLFWLGQQENEFSIRCVNIIRAGDQVLEYKVSEEQQEYCPEGKISNYLYEPNAAIMKAGAFNLLCKKFGLKKLNPNTHLYTSESLIKGFPGRAFVVIGDEAYNKRRLLPLLDAAKANISVRNFPDTPEQVKKKLALKDGGLQYLFGYRNHKNDLRIAVCEKV